MKIVSDPSIDNACSIHLTNEDVESAIRQFIVTCNPELKTGFVVNLVSRANLACLFEAHKPKEPQIVNGMPRRCRIDYYVPAELAIRKAMGAVEIAGAHPLLTDAVNLLQKAQDLVADYVELDEKKS